MTAAGARRSMERLKRRVALGTAGLAVICLGAAVAAGADLWRPAPASAAGSAAASYTIRLAAADSPPLAAAASRSATVSWRPERVIEGTLFTVHVMSGSEPLSGVQGDFADEPLHFTELDGVFTALAGAPIGAEDEVVLRLSVVAETGEPEDRDYAVPVAPGDYRMERLSVAPRYAREQPAEISRRISEEAARARAVSARSHDTPRMWKPPFVAPRESRITSGFGHGRVFNDEVQSRHMGTDFAGAVGAPVRAPAAGIVALVDSFYLGGNVIYIDHGAGLVTGYLHLSEQEVSEGQIVEPGQIIGRVGATGRVTGPHLHWIVRYGGITVDGLSLLGLEL